MEYIASRNLPACKAYRLNRRLNNPLAHGRFAADLLMMSAVAIMIIAPAYGAPLPEHAATARPKSSACDNLWTTVACENCCVLGCVSTTAHSQRYPLTNPGKNGKFLP